MLSLPSKEKPVNICKLSHFVAYNTLRYVLYTVPKLDTFSSTRPIMKMHWRIQVAKVRIYAYPALSGHF